MLFSIIQSIFIIHKIFLRNAWSIIVLVTYKQLKVHYFIPDFRNYLLINHRLTLFKQNIANCHRKIIVLIWNLTPASWKKKQLQENANFSPKNWWTTNKWYLLSLALQREFIEMLKNKGWVYRNRIKIFNLKWIRLVNLREQIIKDLLCI